MNQQLNEKDAEKVFKIIQIVNRIGLKKYNKDWRKIHKEIGISASEKVKIYEHSVYGGITTQPKDKRMKPVPKMSWAAVLYKDYKFYVNHIRRNEEYEISSYYGGSDKTIRFKEEE